MSDSPNAEPTAESTAATENAAPVAEAAEKPEPFADWDGLDQQLERAYQSDPKTAADRLKKHRAIGGIAGSIAERRMAELDTQRDQERQTKAMQDAREELRRLAQERPLEFADRFLTNEQAEEARQRIANVEMGAAKKMMEQIGAAYHGVPEWADLSDDEKTKLREAVDGAGDDALPRFNRVALDIVADRRANKRMSDRLPKEKEAWRKEWEAERLAQEQGPDLRSPSTTVRRRIDWRNVPDDDFNKWWKERFGR